MLCFIRLHFKFRILNFFFASVDKKRKFTHDDYGKNRVKGCSNKMFKSKTAGNKHCNSGNGTASVINYFYKRTRLAEMIFYIPTSVSFVVRIKNFNNRTKKAVLTDLKP